MAYKTNEVIKSELEVLNIAYDDEITNAELQALLDGATGAPDAPEAVTENAPVQAKEVSLGVATINDHEKRITALEQALNA